MRFLLSVRVIDVWKGSKGSEAARLPGLLCVSEPPRRVRCVRAAIIPPPPPTHSDDAVASLRLLGFQLWMGSIAWPVTYTGAECK